MKLTKDKIEEICQEVIKALTKEVKLDGTNLSLIGIFDDDIHDDPNKVAGCGIYSSLHKDVIILW